MIVLTCIVLVLPTGPTACRRSQSLPLWSTFDANYADCASTTAEIGATNPVFSRSTPEWLDLRDCALGAQQPILSDSAIGSFPHRTDSSVDLSCCLELYTNPSSSSVLNASSDDVASSLAHKKFSGVSQTAFLGTPSGDVNFSSPDTELRQTDASYQSNSVETVPSHLPVVQNDMPSADSLARLQSQLIPRLSPEWDFIGSLLRLARRLMPLTSKGQRTAYLQAELANLNLHLPARVWIPVNKADHIILRIPPTAAVCLNSKNKAPYLIYLEVLSCVDPWTEPLPSKPIINTSGQSMNSSTPTGATSFTSLSGCPWNSNTPSSASESGLHPLDAMSLSSDDSVNILKGSIGCLERPLAFESLLPLPNGEITSAASTTADLSSPPNPPVYISASQIRSRLKDQSERHPNYSFISDPEDPSAAVLKEPWRMKCQRIRELSPWGSLPGWRLNAAIIKVGDDLRQEQLAYQLLSVLQRIWQAEYIPLWLRPLKVIVTSPDSGLIEPVPDTVSFHQIRRHARLSLLDYLLKEHGPPNSEAFLTAQRNFVHSCAAYSVVGYLLQVKDRHNSNILLDREGHVIHIDYGFILSASPGKNIGFEASPFKLTAEQVAVMGGVGSDMFEYFKCLLLRGLLAARKHMERICVLVEIARATCPQLPCFARGGGSAAISGLRQRFQMSRTEEQLRQSTEHMVEASLHSITTKLYDSFQYYTNGIQ
ncbi:unnamed protein product [Dicrocoelium dendriticum]|nr:unnamed protein product [Dicrocoelium dendriticum]